MPIADEHSSDKQNHGYSHSHRRHRRRHRKRKKTILEKFVKTLKTNPLKIIAPFFLIALVFISILFFMYDDGDKVLSEDERFLKRNDLVNGILLSNEIINEKKSIQISFGDTGRKSSAYKQGVSVPLEKLQQGYVMSPMDFITCGNEGTVQDSSKFILSLDGNRLYVSMDFKNISTNEIAGSINKKHWTLLSKNISQFYSDDNLFEVLDNQGYVIFCMHLVKPGELFIRGYFTGERCVYIAGEEGLNTQSKEENYIEKALQQIKNIKRTYSSN